MLLSLSPAPAVRAVLAVAASGLCLPAAAADLNALQLLTQPEFRRLAEDIGAVLSYKPLLPAEAAGVTGFDVGVAVTGTELQNRDVWRKATLGGDIPRNLPTTSLRVSKGLPFGIDVGASYASVPTTGLRAIGGEVRWAVLPGSIALPAVALRASASSLREVSELKARTTALDVSVSKGFAVFTPYVGVGVVRTVARPEGVLLLREERFTQNKVFGGVAASLGPARLTVEADRTGDAPSVSAKLSLGF